MGAYTPLPWAPADLVDDVCHRVLRPTVEEMRRRGTPFQGLLYAGLALTARGLRVVEFNARFGDPETQPLLALLRSSLFRLLHAAATGRLDQVDPPRWHPGAAVAVVMAADGYPAAPRKGDPVTGLAEASALEGVDVIHAGTALDGDRLVTAGGRVLAVTAVGTDLMAARQQAYRAVTAISFGGAQYRTDIAATAAVEAADLSGRPSR
jgi:phosphoribosylamine---glycine ligase